MKSLYAAVRNTYVRYRTDAQPLVPYSREREQPFSRARQEDGMGLATLNVWVHDPTDPCKISDTPWKITVTYCNGNPVEWCGHTFSAEEAQCGHAEFQLPPGCYIVRGFTFLLLNKIFFFSLTEHALVIVGCDEAACVHLYTPTVRQVPGGAAMAMRYLAEKEKLPKDKVDAFVAAADALVKELPETSLDKAFDRLIQQLTGQLSKSRRK